MANQLEVRLHGQPVGWITRGSRRERIEFAWLGDYSPGPVLLGDNDAHAKNVGILHLPDRSVLADAYDAVPNLYQKDRINYDLALAVDRRFDHRRTSAAHLIREAKRWNALGSGEAELIVTATLADFAAALDHVTVPQGVPSVATAQLAWNVERLQSGLEIGERPSSYRRRHG